MKNYIASLFLAFTFTSVSAADFPTKISADSKLIDPPVEMVFNFNSYFPEADAVKWTSSQNKTFAEFTNKNNLKAFAVYNNGELIESYYGIPVNHLPVNSLAHLNTKFPNHVVQNVYLINENGTEKILVELENTVDVVYSTDGYLLRYIK